MNAAELKNNKYNIYIKKSTSRLLEDVIIRFK